MESSAPKADDEARRIQVRDEWMGGIRGSMREAEPDQNVSLGERSRQLLVEEEGEAKRARRKRVRKCGFGRLVERNTKSSWETVRREGEVQTGTLRRRGTAEFIHLFR